MIEIYSSLFSLLISGIPTMLWLSENPAALICYFIGLSLKFLLGEGYFEVKGDKDFIFLSYIVKAFKI